MSTTALEWAIAWRYLRSRRGSRLLSFISLIAITGVIVGVSALIVIIGVMNGLQRDLREKILTGSPDVRVLTYGQDLTMPDWRAALDTIRAVPGVVAAAPFVLTQGLAAAGSQYVEGVTVVGLPAEGRDVPEVTTIRRQARQGDFRFASRDGQGRGAVLGSLLAAKLDAFPGDTITLVSPAQVKQGGLLGPLMPRLEAYEVTGVFETGMYEYDNQYLYLALPTAQQFAGLGDAVTGIEVRTTDRWAAPAVAARLTARLGFPYRTVDWQEQNRSLFQALKLEKLGMGVILLLIVVVAAFNIVSTLTMVVRDKTREIGILRAMGLPARAVRRVFVWQGLVIGVVGTGIGLALGLAVAVALGRYRLIALDPSVYFIDHLPVALQVSDTAAIVLASIAIAVVATLYPAAVAARLYPIEAIRSE